MGVRVSKQNRSHAVMAQRTEPHDSLDFFPTPPWATRALVQYVAPGIRHAHIWEPACGIGSMARPLAEYAEMVFASDVHDYGGNAVHDFLQPYRPPGAAGRPDWIVTNPPFRLGEQFALHALQWAKEGVALLVRTAFLESVGRYDRLFRHRPPSIVAQFTERVPMFKGRLDAKGSTATAYCWVVWRSGPTQFLWIPPCRAQLERPGDYDNGIGASDNRTGAVDTVDTVDTIAQSIRQSGVTP